MSERHAGVVDGHHELAPRGHAPRLELGLERRLEELLPPAEPTASTDGGARARHADNRRRHIEGCHFWEMDPVRPRQKKRKNGREKKSRFVFFSRRHAASGVVVGKRALRSVRAELPVLPRGGRAKQSRSVLDLPSRKQEAATGRRRIVRRQAAEAEPHGRREVKKASHFSLIFTYFELLLRIRTHFPALFLHLRRKMLVDIPCDLMPMVGETLTFSELLTLRLVSRSMLAAVKAIRARGPARTLCISPPEYSTQTLRAIPRLFLARVCSRFAVEPSQCTLSLCVGCSGAQSLSRDVEFVLSLATAAPRDFADVGATRLEITNVGPNVSPETIARLEKIVRELPRLTELWLADIVLPALMLGALREATSLRVLDVKLEGVEIACLCSTIAAMKELRALRLCCSFVDQSTDHALRELARTLGSLRNIMEVDMDVQRAS